MSSYLICYSVLHELNTLDAGRSGRCVEQQQQMQNRFGLLDTDVMPMFMITALDIVITLRFSINCSDVICSPTVIFSILREACSETYGPRVYFPPYKFPVYNVGSQFTFVIFYFQIYKPKNPKIFSLSFVQFYLSLSDLTFVSGREGIDNPFTMLGVSV